MDAGESTLALYKTQRHGEKWSCEQDKHREILSEKLHHFSPYGIDEIQFFFIGLGFWVEPIASAIVKHNDFILDEYMRDDSHPFIKGFTLSVFNGL